MNVHVTGHAISRYRRRVEAVSYDTARKALSTDIIRQAVTAGASAVILPSGHKVVIMGNSIVTVKAKHSNKRRRRNV